MIVLRLILYGAYLFFTAWDWVSDHLMTGISHTRTRINKVSSHDQRTEVVPGGTDL